MPHIMSVSEAYKATREQLRAYLKTHGIVTRSKDILYKLQEQATVIYEIDRDVRAPRRRAHRYAVRHANGSHTSPLAYLTPDDLTMRPISNRMLDIITLPTIDQLYKLTLPQLKATGDNLHAILSNPFRRSARRDQMMETFAAVYASRMSHEAPQDGV